MREYFYSYKQFILIGLVWLLVGIYLGPTIYIIVPIMLLLMFRKGLQLEILLGFLLILTLSDSRSHSLGFASQLKNIYIIILFLFSLNIRKQIDFPINIYKYFTPFFLIAFICTPFNPLPFLSFQKTLSYILLFISVPIYFQFIYNKCYDDLLKSIAFFGSLILALGLLINIYNPDFTNLAGRYRGLLGNPNGLGIFVFLFLVFLNFARDKYSSLFSKREFYFIYFIGLISLLMSGSRTAVFALAIFLFFRQFNKISPLLGFIIFVFFIFAYQIISENLIEIITALNLEEQLRVDTIQSGSGRLIAWKFAWDEIQKNFFIGNGFSYTDYIFKLHADYLSVLGHQGHAHNSYLTFWLDTGLIGLILFLGGLLTLFLRAFKKNILAIPLLYSILFFNNFESWITASLNPFTIQLIFTLCIVFIEKVTPSESR